MASQPLFQDNSDATKVLAIDPAAIATATTRTITMPNANVDLTVLGAPAARTILANATSAASPPTAVVIGTDQLLIQSGTTLVSKKIEPHLNVTPSVLTLTDAATVDWNLALGLFATVTLTGNRTLALPTNIAAGTTMVLHVVQDATGSRTLTWNSGFKFPGGTLPVLTTAANARDVFYITCYTASLMSVGSMMDVK